MGGYQAKLTLGSQLLEHANHVSSENFMEDVQPEASALFTISTTMIYLSILFLCFCIFYTIA